MNVLISSVTLDIAKKKLSQSSKRVYFPVIRASKRRPVQITKTKANCDIDWVEWRPALSACKYLNGKLTYRLVFTL